MNLKKIISALLITMCIGMISPAFASGENPVTGTPKSATELRGQEITNRLIEIKNMDKSNLTTSEKKELRKEVKKMKKDRNRNGIYLSVGAVIIIVLLLIILL
ncbi:MAG: hypothetical protein ABI267_00885 [Ginsengibacter sp.]